MKNIHFTGIKGSGMSALAQILHDMNYTIKGSDITKHFFTEEPLRKRGIEITQFSEENITEEMTVVASRAFGEDNPEVRKAKELGNLRYYYDFLGEFINTFENSIAISGCHGKTTTTGLMSHVLSGLKKTSCLIGDGTGKGLLGSKHFVFEACEYKNHFLSYHPDYAVITNIDFDHPDFFKDKNDVINSFQLFANNVKKGLIIYGDQEETMSIGFDGRLLRYGFHEGNDIRAENVRVDSGITKFEVVSNGENKGTITIPMVGEHHILNSLAVCALVELLGEELTKVVPFFATFPGVKRRFNEVFFGTNVLIDDYAHHPTEIKATLQSIKSKYPDKKTVVLFQPHTYSRTKALFNEFVLELSNFDAVYLTEIFGSARESENGAEISSDLMVECIKERGTISEKVESVIPKLFYEFNDSVVAFLGAGDVNKYREEYLMGLLSK